MTTQAARSTAFSPIRGARTAALVLLLSPVCPTLLGQRPDTNPSLEAGFHAPPQIARTSVWWHWINGNVSREGIRADLEDMKRVGIGSVQMIDVAMYSPPGPARYHSDEWYGDAHFAMETAHRLGLTFGVANGPGWSGSGGPWVTPEFAMKRLVWSERTVPGGEVHAKLDQPATRLGFYRDIAVLAIPAEVPDAEPFKTESEPADFFARGANSDKHFSETDKASVAIRYASPVERRTLEVHCARRGCSGSFNLLIEASDDGQSFHPIHTANLFGEQDDPVLTIAFPATTARAFRVRVTSALAKMPQLISFVLRDAARIENVRGKTVNGVMSPVLAAPAEADNGGSIPLDKVLDLTKSMAPDGTLTWTAPPGQWTILRIGYTPTGATVHPPQPEGEGLEIDKMSASVTDFHFEQSLGRLIREAGPLAGTTLKQVVIDSWEAGQQNWTGGFPEVFAKLRGYAILPYLPALTGRVVESPAVSDAFLRDFRHTISEMIAENYYGEFRRLAHRHGLELYAETYPGTAFNEAEATAQADISMTEFWAPGGSGYNGSVKQTASAVHTTGRKLVAAESFTGAPEASGWMWTPATLKMIGDSAFASGLNQSFLHAYVHQPRSDAMPGWTMGRYGTQFGRLEPWWQQAGPWLDYMARCQFLLQQGRPVSDVLALRTEEIDGLRSVAPPHLPQGVDYDWVVVAPVLSASITKDGIRLAHAGTYRALWLPDLWTADLPLLRQIQRMVEAGIPVFGRRPVAPSSLVGLRHLSDWQQVVNALWPENPDTEKRVQPTSSVARILPAHVSTDVILKLQGGGTAPLWIHRRTDDADVYFLANTTKSSVKFSAAFHSGARRPELWNPVTGEHAEAAPFRLTNGGGELPLELATGSSIFVVFRSPLPKRWLQSVTAQGDSTETSLPAQPVAHPFHFTETGTYELTWSDGVKTAQTTDAPVSIAVGTGWSVRFEPPIGPVFIREFSTLQDFAMSTDPAIRYFTGTATYRKKISLTEPQLKDAGCVLELGDVQNIASVRVNGHEAGVLWSTPYTVDITPWIIAGQNTIEIAVINRWVNRLIGDEQLPADAAYATDGSEFNRGRLLALPAWYGDAAKTTARRRTTFASWQHFTSASPLVPSGLIGPVTLRFYRQANASHP